VTRIDAPGADVTTAFGVNNRRQVVGYWSDESGTIHAYLWERGRFTGIDVPGAVGANPIDINERGQIVGIYLANSGAIHGYLWDRGRVTTIDAPGVPITVPFGINNRGQIVGSTLSENSPTADRHGFLLAKGVKGPFTRIDFPGAPRTQVTGINDRGQIVGRYENPNPAVPTPSRASSGPGGEQVLDGGARHDPGMAAPLEQLDGDVVGWWEAVEQPGHELGGGLG
jgi:probable HAF family extracellular repeat protein